MPPSSSLRPFSRLYSALQPLPFGVSPLCTSPPPASSRQLPHPLTWCHKACTFMPQRGGEREQVSCIVVTAVVYAPHLRYKEFEWNDTLQYAFWYHLFGLFWTTQFILAVSELVIMYVVVRWYFSPKNLSGERVGPMAPVCTAWSYVMRYHLGSAVVGSLIIAIIQMVCARVSCACPSLEHREQSANLCLTMCPAATWIRFVLSWSTSTASPR